MQTLRWPLALLAALMMHLAAAPANADSTTADYVAIQGYDVVAYFTDGKPTKGSPDISMPFDDAKWQFASTKHKEMFAADPDHYLPQYGGGWARGMGVGG